MAKEKAGTSGESRHTRGFISPPISPRRGRCPVRFHAAGRDSAKPQVPVLASTKWVTLDVTPEGLVTPGQALIHSTRLWVLVASVTRILWSVSLPPAACEKEKLVPCRIGNSTKSKGVVPLANVTRITASSVGWRFVIDR